MELYGFFRSSTSYRLRIALNLKGLAYEPRYVSLPKMEHRADGFLAVNPQGLVPALVDQGRVFTQSLAIIEYLDETHPEPPLLPANPVDRAYVRAVAQIMACDIHPLNNVRVLKYLQSRWKLSDADRDEWYAHWIAEGFRGLEAYLQHEKRFGRFVLGDEPGLADICLVPQVFNAERFNCDLSAYPTCVAIHQNCMALESFEKALPKYQADAF
jgi:maleylacetoacetate isomerase